MIALTVLEALFLGLLALALYELVLLEGERAALRLGSSSG
jgi:hypothetical protein